MSDLLDLLREIEAPARAKMMHVVLPSMGWVCGGTILDGGRQTFGAAGWENVTCPDCLAPGRREVARLTHRQQHPPEHVCEAGICWWMTVDNPITCPSCGDEFAADGRRARLVADRWEHLECDRDAMP